MIRGKLSGATRILSPEVRVPAVGRVSSFHSFFRGEENVGDGSLVEFDPTGRAPATGTGYPDPCHSHHILGEGGRGKCYDEENIHSAATRRCVTNVTAADVCLTLPLGSGY